MPLIENIRIAAHSETRLKVLKAKILKGTKGFVRLFSQVIKIVVNNKAAANKRQSCKAAIPVMGRLDVKKMIVVTPTLRNTTPPQSKVRKNAGLAADAPGRPTAAQ